jgi:hypothetical protein
MYSGNAVVVNIVMRWPWLVVPVAALGVITVVPPAKLAPLLPEPVARIVLPPPPPIVPPIAKLKPPPLEDLCPPIEKTVKLSKKEKKVLIDKGCKVKG